ncbi:MAG: hypothetical protein FJW30_22650 [Acidobacteria bacterium]|nr:hypothetical protein [Acidobacteriota bacterium]
MAILRAHSNASNNGRYDTAAGTHEWHTKWRAVSPPDAQPVFLLGNGFDAFVNADFAWLRYERSELVDRRRRPSGDAAWDTGRELVYTTDEENHFTAIPTHAHAAGFTVPLVGGAHAQRIFLHRHADTLIAASLTAQIGGGQMATIETVALRESVFQRRGLRIEPGAGGLRIALHNDFLIVAFAERIEILDLDLQTKRTLQGDYRGGGLSVDGTARMILTRNTEALFLTISGQSVSVALPDGPPYLPSPPLIGLDNTAYILGPRRVVAIDDAGRIAWQYETPDRIAGGAITGDDRLLIATGSRILRLTNKGQVAVMQTFSGETILAAPSFDAAGNLFAVTNKHVHCLWRG